MQKHLLCLGYGYSADVIAKRLRQDDWLVTGTTRSADNADAMKAQGVAPIIWDGKTSLIDEKLNGVTHILQSIPPNADGDIAMQTVSEQLGHLSSVVWVGYLSTTGVYGNTDGDWVDETSPLKPTNKRSEQRVIAEQQWLEWGDKFQKAVHIFRLSGIYGADRNSLTKVKNGEARRLKIDNHYFSRIHVEDIATVVYASIQKPDAGAIYNLADDMPTSGADVTTYAAELLGIDPPPLQTLDEADLSPMAKSFYSNSKRVSNKKIKNALQVDLAFPTYKVGLDALFKNNDY